MYFLTSFQAKIPTSTFIKPAAGPSALWQKTVFRREETALKDKPLFISKRVQLSSNPCWNR
jgi:hypothetical protein